MTPEAIKFLRTIFSQPHQAASSGNAFSHSEEPTGTPDAAHHVNSIVFYNGRIDQDSSERNM